MGDGSVNLTGLTLSDNNGEVDLGGLKDTLEYGESWNIHHGQLGRMMLSNAGEVITLKKDGYILLASSPILVPGDRPRGGLYKLTALCFMKLPEMSFCAVTLVLFINCLGLLVFEPPIAMEEGHLGDALS